MKWNFFLVLILTFFFSSLNIFAQNKLISLSDGQISSVITKANIKVTHTSDQRLFGEFLIDKEQILTGNSNIWIVTGSLVIYKRIPESVHKDANSFKSVIKNGIDVALRTVPSLITGQFDPTSSINKNEFQNEFETILSTKFLKGTGGSIHMAINNIINSLIIEDIIIAN